MPFILCIETATEICSVAVVNQTQVLSYTENTEGNMHAQVLTKLISTALQAANISLAQLDAVAVSKGPGSYTGLRVGVSTAKGLCYALNKPLIAINTLEALANQLILLNPNKIPNYLCIPMIDARRMEVYCAIYNQQLEQAFPTSAIIINEQSFANELAESQVYFVGNGASKCSTIINHPNAVFLHDIKCSARGMQSLAIEAFNKSIYVNTAYFEPFYLKDFVATTPKRII